MHLSSRCPRQKRSSMDGGSVEELLRGQKVSRSIDLAIERCQDCDKKQLKSSIDKLSVEELSRLLKNSFSRREKDKHECNRTRN